MFELLEQLEIEFTTQYKSDWSQLKSYDFYLPSLNTIIETNGRQHYEDTGFEHKGGRSVKEEQDNDRLKEQLAKENEIENYIIIDCRKSELDWIRDNILQSKLSELFDLNKVDWNKCDEFTLTNKVKQVCEIKNNNPEITIVEICKETKLNRYTIKNYLMKGAKYGWCEYTPKDIMTQELINNLDKPIEIFNDNISLGIFYDIMKLEKESVELFGVQFSRKHIRRVCTGKQKSHAGLVFKYVD